VEAATRRRASYFSKILNIDIDIRLGEEENKFVVGMYSFVERVSHDVIWLKLGFWWTSLQYY